jgi:hypothetical protein
MPRMQSLPKEPLSTRPHTKTRTFFDLGAKHEKVWTYPRSIPSLPSLSSTHVVSKLGKVSERRYKMATESTGDER